MLPGQFSRLAELHWWRHDGGWRRPPSLASQATLRQVLLWPSPAELQSAGQPPGGGVGEQEPGAGGQHTGPPQEDRHWLDAGGVPGPLLPPGLPQCGQLSRHRPGPDVRLHLPAAAPGCCLPQYRLQAVRPQTSLPLQAGHLHWLQHLHDGAAEHGDVGPPEAAVGALHPDLPWLPLPHPVPPGDLLVTSNTEDGWQAVSDLSNVGGHGVQVLQCEVFRHGERGRSWWLYFN